MNAGTMLLFMVIANVVCWSFLSAVPGVDPSTGWSPMDTYVNKEDCLNATDGSEGKCANIAELEKQIIISSSQGISTTAAASTIGAYGSLAPVLTFFGNMFSLVTAPVLIVSEMGFRGTILALLIQTMWAFLELYFLIAFVRGFKA